ncbi:unnamed protein product [Linum tenue]|uniref:Uncharacterized protein n=1 Tax=Linum tenue TaxID=586396 RepID=A0AAV0MHX6_9ROSI|nr:unnamed protein product [Linum tenue]
MAIGSTALICWKLPTNCLSSCIIRWNTESISATANLIQPRTVVLQLIQG